MLVNIVLWVSLWLFGESLYFFVYKLFYIKVVVGLLLFEYFLIVKSVVKFVVYKLGCKYFMVFR